MISKFLRTYVIAIACLLLAAVTVQWMRDVARQREKEQQAKIDEQIGIDLAKQVFSGVSQEWLSQYVARGCPEETPLSTRKPGCPDAAYGASTDPWTLEPTVPFRADAPTPTDLPAFNAPMRGVPIGPR